ncbi:hypothetical protein GCM10007392_37750 [Saccharospirillum salsuginis]|uniref:Putative zinc-finger domain-containing protein n=2 Tax=Saccharospirillum salsuginis TaxID=418750 RepID=A0A918KKA8_9GAMM|nr:hypothetical protein GCM10007392_37750 [Saccharospirillum salsuginis]
MSPRDIRCEEVIEQLFDYLDRELDEEMQHRIERHIEHCRDCFTRAEFEKRLRRRLGETSRVAAPESLHRRLREVMESF